MLGLRGRVAATAVAASATALLAVLVLVGPGLRQRAMDHTRDRLFAEARLMARVVEEPLARDAGPEEFDPLVDEVARKVSARVTIIALDGRVLGDSPHSVMRLFIVSEPTLFTLPETPLTFWYDGIAVSTFETVCA